MVAGISNCLIRHRRLYDVAYMSSLGLYTLRSEHKTGRLQIFTRACVYNWAEPLVQ